MRLAERATSVAISVVTSPSRLCRSGCAILRGNATSWNITVTSRRRRAYSQEQNGMFIALRPYA